MIFKQFKSNKFSGILDNISKKYVSKFNNLFTLEGEKIFISNKVVKIDLDCMWYESNETPVNYVKLNKPYVFFTGKSDDVKINCKYEIYHHEDNFCLYFPNDFIINNKQLKSGYYILVKKFNNLKFSYDFS